MPLTRSCLLVATLMLVALLSGPQSATATATATATVAIADVLPFTQSPLYGKAPLEWSVGDVEYWMNHTIGYAEYSGYVRAHLIDGVTLLEMEPADFESYLPIENALHVVKIGAHVKLLKGRCHCDADGSISSSAASGEVEFWSYMRAHSVRTWGWGTTALFFPRWAMAGVYLLDRELYLNVVGSAAVPSEADLATHAADAAYLKKAAGRGGERTVSLARAAAYWLSFLVTPDLYMAYQAARLTPRNYILMPCVVAHFLAQTFSEASLLITIYRRTAFKPSTPLLECVWVVFSYTLFAPVLGLVAGCVFPVFLQYITVAVIIIHSFLMIIGIVILVVKDGLAAATNGPEDPRYAAAAAAASTEAEAAASAASSGTEKTGDNTAKAAAASSAEDEEGGSKSEKID